MHTQFAVTLDQILRIMKILNFMIEALNNKPKQKITLKWHIYITVDDYSIPTGAFYYQLGNLHPKHRSSLASIQLVAIVEYHTLKQYKLKAILKSFMDSIRTGKIHVNYE